MRLDQHRRCSGIRIGHGHCQCPDSWIIGDTFFKRYIFCHSFCDLEDIGTSLRKVNVGEVLCSSLFASIDLNLDRFFLELLVNFFFFSGILFIQHGCTGSYIDLFLVFRSDFDYILRGNEFQIKVEDLLCYDRTKVKCQILSDRRLIVNRFDLVGIDEFSSISKRTRFVSMSSDLKLTVCICNYDFQIIHCFIVEDTR